MARERVRTLNSALDTLFYPHAVAPEGWNNPGKIRLLRLTALACLGHRARINIPLGLIENLPLPYNLRLLTLQYLIDSAAETPSHTPQEVIDKVENDAKKSNLKIAKFLLSGIQVTTHH